MKISSNFLTNAWKKFLSDLEDEFKEELGPHLIIDLLIYSISFGYLLGLALSSFLTR